MGDPPQPDQLPQAYATALRLRDEGLDDAAIAERLSVAPEAVPSMLRVAEAKLARSLRAASLSRPSRDGDGGSA